MALQLKAFERKSLSYASVYFRSGEIMIDKSIIYKTNELIKWIDEAIRGLEFQFNHKNIIAASCLDMSQEHHKAILLLSANDIFGSALALVRPTFESYIRGIWIKYCASENEMNRFKRGKIPDFYILIEEIEKKDAFNCGTLSKIKHNSLKSMHDYTHTGIKQVTRRIGKEAIESNYDEDEIIEALNFTSSISCLSAIALCDIAENVEVANKILDRFKGDFPNL